MKVYTNYKLFTKEVLKKLSRSDSYALLEKICNKDGRSIILNGIKYSWTFKYVNNETYFTVTIK